MKITFNPVASGRLDIVLAEKTGYTRSYVKQLVEKQAVTINGEAAKKSGQNVKAGDEIALDEPELVTKLEKKTFP